VVVHLGFIGLKPLRRVLSYATCRTGHLVAYLATMDRALLPAMILESAALARSWRLHVHPTMHDVQVQPFPLPPTFDRQPALSRMRRIAQGSWVVKQAVGTTPTLLGKKLTTRYHRGPNYFEVDVDVGSSATAASVVGLVQGALRSLVIDMAVLLEVGARAHRGSAQSQELPETLASKPSGGDDGGAESNRKLCESQQPSRLLRLCTGFMCSSHETWLEAVLIRRWPRFARRATICGHWSEVPV
jgi:Protein ENHANCED DISEASE RESISTANCE 2, C-terminal